MASENVSQGSLSLAEAERFSGLSRETLLMLIENGEIDGTTMIDAHSLENYVRNHGHAEQLRLFD